MSTGAAGSGGGRRERQRRARRAAGPGAAGPASTAGSVGSGGTRRPRWNVRRGTTTAGGAARAAAAGKGGAANPAVSCTWPSADQHRDAVGDADRSPAPTTAACAASSAPGRSAAAARTKTRARCSTWPTAATLENVILGNPAADGIHCEGTCTLKNVWWEDVGEDAATLQGSSASQVMTIDGGGAQRGVRQGLPAQRSGHDDHQELLRPGLRQAVPLVRQLRHAVRAATFELQNVIGRAEQRRRRRSSASTRTTTTPRSSARSRSGRAPTRVTICTALHRQRHGRRADEGRLRRGRHGVHVRRRATSPGCRSCLSRVLALIVSYNCSGRERARADPGAAGRRRRRWRWPPSG